MTDSEEMRQSLDARIGQLAWEYRAARMEGRDFDVEKALAELPESARGEARALLGVGKLVLDSKKIEEVPGSPVRERS